jgi:hypothetical protein
MVILQFFGAIVCNSHLQAPVLCLLLSSPPNLPRCMHHWSFRYPVSLGLAVSNVIILTFTFRFRSQDGWWPLVHVYRIIYVVQSALLLSARPWEKQTQVITATSGRSCPLRVFTSSLSSLWCTLASRLRSGVSCYILHYYFCRSLR